MTGKQLIRWIEENKAENILFVLYDKEFDEYYDIDPKILIVNEYEWYNGIDLDVGVYVEV